MAQANVQAPTDDQLAAMLAALGIQDDDSGARPVPASGPYGPPAVVRDALPSTMNPLAAALSGGMPDAPASALAPPPPAARPPAPPPQDRSPGFLQMLANGLSGGGSVPDNSGGYVPSTNSRVASNGSFLPPGSYSAAPQGAQIQPAAYRAPPQTAAAPSIVVPGYEAKGPLTRAQVVAAPDSDNSMPAEEDWDAAAKARGISSAVPSAPAEDFTTAAYRALHDQAVAHYDQNIAAARAAAAAGHDPSGFIKLAGDAAKVAEEISEKAIDYGKPAADFYQNVTLPNGQVVPFNKSTGSYGTPFGTPTVPPRPVTADERTTWDLPPTGAFTIAPGEVPKQISGAGPQGEPLDQPSIDYLAMRLSKGDNTALSGLGYSKVGAENRARVINRAAAMGAESGMDAGALAAAQIGNQVSLGGQKQEARTSGGLGARINTFAEEANQTGAQALQASDALPRGQWLPINQIEQMGEAAASNPALSTFKAANNAFANTYSKAVNPSGVPTDEGRRAAFDLLNVAKSPEAYRATVLQLQREMRIVQNAVGTVRAQQGGGTAAPSAPMPVGGSTVINGIHIQRVN